MSKSIIIDFVWKIPNAAITCCHRQHHLDNHQNLKTLSIVEIVQEIYLDINNPLTMTYEI